MCHFPCEAVLTYAKYAAGGLAARSPKFPQFYDFLEKREQFNIALFFYGSDGSYRNYGNNGKTN